MWSILVMLHISKKRCHFFMSSVFFASRFGLLFYSCRDLWYVLVGFVPTHFLVKRTNGKWKEDCTPCTSTSTLQLNDFILKHNTPSLLLTSCIIIGGDSLSPFLVMCNLMHLLRLLIGQYIAYSYRLDHPLLVWPLLDFPWQPACAWVCLMLFWNTVKIDFLLCSCIC